MYFYARAVRSAEPKLSSSYPRVLSFVLPAHSLPVKGYTLLMYSLNAALTHPFALKSAAYMKRTRRIWPKNFNRVTLVNWFNAGLNGKLFVPIFFVGVLITEPVIVGLI